MPQFPLFNRPPAPQGPPEYISEDDPRKQTSFLDAPADFVRGMGYFPSEPLPADASKAYSAGAALANTAPLLGPALKGLGMAAPLITIFKDAEGVPSAALRAEGTQKFVDMARTLPHRMRAAAEQFAQDYPRVAAHMRPEYGLPPADSPRAAAYVQTPAGKVTEPMKTGFTHIGRHYTETPESYEAGLNQARQMMYHEGTHAAQALGNKDFNELYGRANRLVGYDLNPFERTAERAGNRAVGSVTSGNRTAIDQLRELAAVYGIGPNTDKIKSILELREMTPTQDVWREAGMAASTKPSIVKPEVDLSRLPASIDYVQGVLKEHGMAPMASHEVNPAVQALSEALQVPEAVPSLAQHAATSRTTGRLRPVRDYIELPEGVEFPPGFKRSPSAPLSEEEQIWRSWSRAQKEMRKDPRGRMISAHGPEVRQVESGPTVRGEAELQGLAAAAPEAKEQAPLVGKWGGSRGSRALKPGRIPFNKLTPEDIKGIQADAGSGLNQKQLMEKYPNFTKETLARVVKMPWKD